MKTSEHLKAAKQRIADPANWCRHYLAMTFHGRLVEPKDPLARKWCSAGAVDATVDGILTAVLTYLRKAVAELKGYESITVFNDTHEHHEVMRMFDLAISYAEADEAKAAETAAGGAT